MYNKKDGILVVIALIMVVALFKQFNSQIETTESSSDYVHEEHNTSLEEQAEEEKYELANEELNFAETEGYRDFSKAELEALYRTLDYEKLNYEISLLINEHRRSLGLKELEYYSEYKEGSEQISKELADYGYITPEGQDPHTRPNGEDTDSVFDEDLYYRGVGENLSFSYNKNNPYTLVSEKHLAERFFNNWMNSEGHRKNMESTAYTGFSFAVYPVTNGNTMRAEKGEDGQYHNYEQVPESWGIGIMGTLTLIVSPD